MGLICFKSELLNIILQKNHFLQSVQCDTLLEMIILSIYYPMGSAVLENYL